MASIVDAENVNNCNMESTSLSSSQVQRNSSFRAGFRSQIELLRKVFATNSTSRRASDDSCLVSQFSSLSPPESPKLNSSAHGRIEQNDVPRIKPSRGSRLRRNLTTTGADIASALASKGDALTVKKLVSSRAPQVQPVWQNMSNALEDMKITVRYLDRVARTPCAREQLASLERDFLEQANRLDASVQLAQQQLKNCANGDEDERLASSKNLEKALIQWRLRLAEFLRWVDQLKATFASQRNRSGIPQDSLHLLEGQVRAERLQTCGEELVNRYRADATCFQIAFVDTTSSSSLAQQQFASRLNTDCFPATSSFYSQIMHGSTVGASNCTTTSSFNPLEKDYADAKSTNSTQVFADVVNGEIVDATSCHSSPQIHLDNVNSVMDDRRIMEDIIELSQRAKASVMSAAAAGLRLSATDTNLAAAAAALRRSDEHSDSDYDNIPPTTSTTTTTRYSGSSSSRSPHMQPQFKSCDVSSCADYEDMMDGTSEQVFIEEGSTESETETKVEEFTDPVTGRARRRRIKITRKTKTIRERILRTAPANCLPPCEGPLPVDDPFCGAGTRLSIADSCASSSTADSSAASDAQSLCTTGSRASCSSVQIRAATRPRPSSQVQNYMQVLGGYDRAVIDLTRQSAESFTLWQERWRKEVLLDTATERCKTISYVSKETQQPAQGTVWRRNTTVSQTTRVRLVTPTQDDLLSSDSNGSSDVASRHDAARLSMSSRSSLPQTRLSSSSCVAGTGNVAAAATSESGSNHRRPLSVESLSNESHASHESGYYSSSHNSTTTAKFCGADSVLTSGSHARLSPTTKLCALNLTSSSTTTSKKKKPPNRCHVTDCMEHEHARCSTLSCASSVSSCSAGAGEENDLILQASLMDYLIFENNNAKENEQGLSIKAGTVDALIVFACGSEGSRLDQILFAEAFLATYRTFVSASQLIDKLIRRCLYFKDLALCGSGSGVEESAKQSAHVRLWRGVFSFLIRVIAELHRDLTPTVFDRLANFKERLLIDGNFGEGQMLANKLTEQCTAKVEADKREDSAPPAALQVHIRRHSLRDFKPREMAEQITLLAADCYRRIEIQEYLVMSGSAPTTAQSAEFYCRNLKRYIDNFNELGYWMKTMILLGGTPGHVMDLECNAALTQLSSLSEKRCKKRERDRRERVLIYFLKVASELLDLQNYHSYLSITSQAVGLDLAWSKDVSRQLDDIRAELADQSAFANKFHKSMAKIEPPFIPYVGSMMGYLTKLSEVTGTYLDSSQLSANFPALPDNAKPHKWVVNFGKCFRIATIMDYFVRNKRYDSDAADYKIQSRPDIMAFINDYKDALNDNALNEIMLTQRKAERC